MALTRSWGARLPLCCSVMPNSTSQSSRGDQASAKTLTTFKKARDKSGLTGRGTAPTFHEQRSLSERLYREQGIDTQKLLGHKPMKMTDRYNDDRGKGWIVVGKKQYDLQSVLGRILGSLKAPHTPKTGAHRLPLLLNPPTGLHIRDNRVAKL